MRLLVLAAMLVAPLAGCLTDDPTSDQQVETPDPVPEELPLAEVTGFGEPLAVELPRSGQGIWIHEDVLYHTNGGDLHVLEVSDPAAPRLLGALEGVGARDVDVLEIHDRTLALLAGSGRGMHVVDVTDPTEPELLVTVDLPSAGVHNLAVVPGTPFVYSSGASGDTRAIDVLDLTDLQDPLVHTFAIPEAMGGVPVQSDGCHDITVRVDLERAYCAGGGGKYAQGGGETFLWDISEEAGGPTDPTWISMLDDPRIVYHHQAFASASGELLIVNDEFIAPNCLRVDSPLPGALDPQVPFAAAWVWDVSDESRPVLRSFVQNPAALEDPASVLEDPTTVPNCGSHFGDLLPDQDKFVMGWYDGGTLMVDFADPDDARIVARLDAAGSTWDARYHNGHVFHASGDLLSSPLVFAE